MSSIAGVKASCSKVDTASQGSAQGLKCPRPLQITPILLHGTPLCYMASVCLALPGRQRDLELKHFPLEFIMESLLSLW